MGAGTLTIYNASAGSGKTFRLTGVYLERLFRLRWSYRRILAVTFTNKATAEMKLRILDELNNLATGGESGYLSDLESSTGKDEESIRREAKEILRLVLHDYSRFYVSTIDSFFQKILRAFARDIGLHSGFNIEIDQSRILSAAVDKVIASASSETTVRNWLTGFVRANIEDEKSWDLRKSILDLSEELLREKFKLLTPEEKTRLRDKDFLLSYIREIRAISSGFKRNMKELGEKCMSIFVEFSLTDEMFFRKGQGIPGFIRPLAVGILKAPNSYVHKIEIDPPKWSTGNVPAPLAAALSSGFGEAVIQAVHYYDENIKEFNTANIILSNIYSLGILSDVLNQIQLIARDENIFLLSDTGELIYLITEKDQAPFIYEKVGNTFESFMIDEFQDTSIIQWKNFRSLIENSMSQGGDNLVVGDIKQSIYRWRNSDWHTLNDLRKAADNKRFIGKPLNTNWRSCANIIKFNNTLFSVIPFLVDRELQDQRVNFGELFSEAVQTDPGRKEKGYVRIEFVEGTEENNWYEIILHKLPGIIEFIQDRGYHASDIGILVRNNREGADVLKRIIGYSASCSEEKKAKYNYNIVSNDSLLLSNSAVVNFLLAVLSVLDNPADLIARALMLRNYLLATGKNDADKVPLPAKDIIEYSAGYFPEGYQAFLDSVRFQPLWDITEKTIKFFGLGCYSFNVSYLNSFQDIVINYTSGRNPGIPSFLEWWESEGTGKSISLPEQQDAVQVLTIHKSKGLEFGIVIIPFLAWNLDHNSHFSNILWVRPGIAPFNKAGIVPVRYKKDLSESMFSEQYYDEKYSAYLDNLNLLYVAMTRAENAIFGFAPCEPGTDSRIASLIKDAITFDGKAAGGPESFLIDYYDRSAGVFEYGELPEIKSVRAVREPLQITDYEVNDKIQSLRLRLHWENYIQYDKSKAVSKINYGKLMHEVFGEIITVDDIPSAVRKKVLEGQIPLQDETATIKRLTTLIERPDIRYWFEKGNVVINEASILLPGSDSRRPDRVILRDGKAIIIDFKFGEENPHHQSQVRQYKRLLTEMGYSEPEGWLWYVDTDKIVQV
jgi:ATP-dependent helicase/nuclease subunit A